MTNHEQFDITQFPLNMLWGTFNSRVATDDQRGKILAYLCLKTVFGGQIAAGTLQPPTVTTEHRSADLRFHGTTVNAKISRLNFCCTRTDKTGFHFGRNVFCNEAVTLGFCLPDISAANEDDRVSKRTQLTTAGFQLLDAGDTLLRVIEKSRIVMATADMEKFTGQFYNEKLAIFIPLSKTSRTKDCLWNMIVKKENEMNCNVSRMSEYFRNVVEFMKNPPLKTSEEDGDSSGEEEAFTALLDVARKRKSSARTLDNVLKRVKHQLKADKRTAVQLSATSSTSTTLTNNNNDDDDFASN